MSNNSRVSEDGSEISISQFCQADILHIPKTYHINPVLLKSGNKGLTLILNGQVVEDMDTREYYENIDNLKQSVSESYEYLDERYDIVINEGAGSPVELNLMDKDLSNFFIADTYHSKIIIVADIERSGVFASIYGTYALLPKKQQDNVIGVIVNKFQGDMALFDEGITIIEKQFGIPVLGVVPKLRYNYCYEDSQSLKNYTQEGNAHVNIGVIAFPHMSNFNDFEPLLADSALYVEFATSLKSHDYIILPGSKQTMKDLKWLKETGLFKQLQQTNIPIFGICGGYEMMFENIIDEHGVEEKGEIQGLGFFKGEVHFKKEKVLKNTSYEQFGMTLSGFEIHQGYAEQAYIDARQHKGTFLHGIFENDPFRAYLYGHTYNYEAYKQEVLENLIASVDAHIDMDKIENALR